VWGNLHYQPDLGGYWSIEKEVHPLRIPVLEDVKEEGESVWENSLHGVMIHSRETTLHEEDGKKPPTTPPS